LLAALAVERLGEDARGRGLADAAGAGEEVGVRDASRLDRPRQHLAHVVLADEVGEHLRPVLESQRAVRHRRPLPCERAPRPEQKGPGGKGAPPSGCFPLLPSGPDGVHKLGLRWAWPNPEKMVEMSGFEPPTPSLRTRCSPS